MKAFAIALPFVLAFVGAAPAQNALGDGRGLERDMRVGGGGLTPREDFGAIVRYRNAVVTGQAPGGASLRVGVGYTDPSDFTARLGSDSLYRFRRDSLYSGLAGIGFRGTESLQFQFTQATGNTRRGADPYLMQRSAGVRQASGSDRPAFAPESITQFADGARAGTLRSTSAYQANRSLQPVVIGMRNVAGQPEPVATSTLLGVKGYAPRPYDAPKEEKAPGEGPDRAAAAVESAAPTPARTAYDDLRDRATRLAPDLLKPTAGPTTPEVKPETKPETKPEVVVPGTPTPPTTPKPPGTTPATEPNKPNTPESKPDTPGAIPGLEAAWSSRVNDLREALRSMRNKAGADGKGAVDPTATRLDKDVLAIIRRAGDEETKSYIAAAEAGALKRRDPYASSMEQGQRLLQNEQYFDAEERFALALTLKSGDVSAQAGRLHAQLGSGLFVSAANNLRRLIEENPDAAAMRYSLDLLPSLQRQRALVTQLRKNITGTEVASMRVPRESALLLAYLGYQRRDEGVLREGLTALQREAPEEDEMFIQFLEGVWHGDVK